MGFIGDCFFFSTDLRIPVYLGIEGDQFFSDLRNFLGGHFMYKMVYYSLYHVSFFTKIECNEFARNKFVLVLLQIDIIQSVLYRLYYINL
jgi:hypothetical protein